MKSEGKRNERTNFDTNLRRYKSEYFSEFPNEKIDKLENLKQDYPLLFQELIVTASLSSLLGEDERNSNYTENVKLVKKYQDWLKLTQTDMEKIAMEIPDSHKNVNFVEKLLEADFDITKVKF
jgi:rRNA maturation endonuclease Nob1